MPLLTTESIVLQVFPYGDTSKIVRLLTPSRGVQSVIAKGALRPRSRFGGVLEPFAEGTATFYARDGRDLHTLGGFDLSRSRQSLGRDLLRFGAASLLAELVLRTAIEQADPELYARLHRALERLERSGPNPESTALAEVWGLIAHLGFAPTLDACLSCGRDVEEQEDTSFDYAAGGVRCSACARHAPGRALPPAARAVLLRLISGEDVALERTGAHWRLLSRYLTHHVLDGQSLHALEFISESLEPAT